VAESRVLSLLLMKPRAWRNTFLTELYCSTFSNMVGSGWEDQRRLVCKAQQVGSYSANLARVICAA
jgi:hypothetical protein